MAKRTKKTHPERAVLKGSGGEYVVTKVQMLFETTKLLAKKFRKKYQSLIFRYRIRLISFIHRALSRMRLL